MSRFFTLLLILFLVAPGWSAPNMGLIDKLLTIAEPDQREAFQKLQLSEKQLSELQLVAYSYIPVIYQHQGEPGRLITLVPEVLTRVDTVLTPRQRPLARRLIPRPHQWQKLRDLYQEF